MSPLTITELGSGATGKDFLDARARRRRYARGQRIGGEEAVPYDLAVRPRRRALSERTRDVERDAARYAAVKIDREQHRRSGEAVA
jgi:hypothetical protein